MKKKQLEAENTGCKLIDTQACDKTFKTGKYERAFSEAECSQYPSILPCNPSSIDFQAL